MDVKPVYASITIWGAVLTMVGVLLHAIGIDADDQLSKVKDMLPTLVQLFGIGVVIYGRLRAGGAQPVTQTQADRQQDAAAGLKPMGG